jgi:hypothetical protein
MRWCCWHAGWGATYIKTRDVTPQPSAGKHAPLPRFCESRPVQLAASHLVRAEATVRCRGRGRSASRTTEFRGSLFPGLREDPFSRMGSAALRATQSRWVGGTRHMMVAYEGGVFLRRLGCYGDPNRARAHRAHGLSFASCHPCSGTATA